MNKNLLNKALLILALACMLMLPIVVAEGMQDDSYSSILVSDDSGLESSSFSNIRPYTREGIFAKGEKTSLMQTGTVAVGTTTAVGVTSATYASCTAVCPSLAPIGTVLIIVGAVIVVGVAIALIVNGASGYEEFSDVIFGLSVTNTPDYYFIEGHPSNVTLTIDCRGTDCSKTFTGTKYISLVVDTPEQWDVTASGVVIENEYREGTKTIFNLKLDGKFDIMKPIVTLLPKSGYITTEVNKTVYFSLLAGGKSSGTVPLSFTLYPMDFDYTPQLCRAANFSWDDSYGCCGDDNKSDCGMINEARTKICVGDAALSNWNTLDATSYNYTEKVIDVGCGHYTAVSTGKEWVACLAKDALPPNCVLSMSDVTNAHSALCGIYAHNIICDAPKGYNMSCGMYQGQTCPEGTGVRIGSISDPLNGHFATISGSNYNFTACCKAENARGDNILLSAGGSYHKRIAYIRNDDNSHLSFDMLTDLYRQEFSLNSNDPNLSNFNCSDFIIDAEPEALPDPDIAVFSPNPLSKGFVFGKKGFKRSLVNPNCLLSFGGATNAHAGPCGAYNTNLNCRAPEGYELSCEIRKSCSSNEVNVVELSTTRNAHLAMPATGYANKLCCMMTNDAGTQLLTSTGASSKTLFWIYNNTNSHASTTSGSREIKLFSSDPSVASITCATETAQPTAVLPTRSPDNATMTRDFVCVLDAAGKPTATECSGTESAFNSFYYKSLGQGVISAGVNYYCTGNKLWTDDLDYSQQICESNTIQNMKWIGNGTTVGLGYCCGDDREEYFNYPFNETGRNNLGSGCWNSSMVLNEQYPPFNGTVLEQFINLNGTFYGCVLEGDLWRYTEIKESNTGDYFLKKDQVKDKCALVGNWFCSVNGTWKNLSAVSGNVTNISFLNLSKGLGLTRDEYVNKSLYECCPSGYCWDQAGEKCVSGDVENGDFNLIDDYVCYYGQWVPKTEGVKFDWDGDMGYCGGDQCPVVNLMPTNLSSPITFCADNGNYIEDHFCEKGKWVTRTAAIARELLTYVRPEDSYILFCDDADKVLAYISSDFTVQTGTVADQSSTSILQGAGMCASDELYQFKNDSNRSESYPDIWVSGGEGYKGVIPNLPCTNKFCVIRINYENGSTKNVVFGFSYNNYNTSKDPDFNIEKFFVGGNQRRLSNVPNVIIYDLKLTPVGLIPQLWEAIGNFVDWLYGIFTGQNPMYRISEVIGKTTQRIYYAHLGSKEIYGIIDDPNFTGDRNMLLTYRCFTDTDLSKFSTKMMYGLSGSTQYLFSSDPNIIDEYWLEMTAKVRMQPGGTTCTPSESTCFDSDGENKFTFGFVKILNNTSGEIMTLNDSCDNGRVVEKSCSADGKSIVSTLMTCENGCMLGECLKANPFGTPYVMGCRDSDGALATKQNTVKGYTQGLLDGNITLLEDACLNPSQAIEYSCSGNDIMTSTSTCAGGCTEGACKCNSDDTCDFVGGYLCISTKCEKDDDWFSRTASLSASYTREHTNTSTSNCEYVTPDEGFDATRKSVLKYTLGSANYTQEDECLGTYTLVGAAKTYPTLKEYDCDPLGRMRYSLVTCSCVEGKCVV